MRRIFTLLLFATLIVFNANGQTNPCSINTDEEINICYLDNQLTLTAFAGADVDLSSIEWSTIHTNLFTIGDPNSLITVINVVPSQAPVGCYEFTLTGSCITGTQNLSKTVTLCVKPDATLANITVDGVSVDDYAACTEVVLEGNTNLNSDEFGLWINAEPYPDLQITGLNGVSNELTVSLLNKRIAPCEEYLFYYQVSNGGCFSIDSIVVTLEGQNETINIFAPSDGVSYCANSVTFRGTNISCASGLNNFSYKLQNPSQYFPAPVSTSKTILQNETRETFTFYVSGWYTFTYNVDDTATCEGGSDSVTIYVCVEGADQPLHASITELYCEEIPEQIKITDPLYADYTYGDLIVSSSNGSATAVQDGDDVIITNPNSENTFITVRQEYVVAECEGNPCIATRWISLLKGPDIELEADTFTYLCGGLYQWNPWSQVNISGFGFQRLKVLASPVGSNVIVGTEIVGATAIFNLVATGLYQFEMKMFRTSNGVTCEDSAILTVLICDPGEPSAPTITDFCAGDTVQIVGTIPMDTCAAPFWNQLSGPEITFVNGTGPTDINPYITVADTGAVSLEYSYSREEYCYLSDTSTFNVLECEEECITVTVLELFCDNEGTDEEDDDFWYFEMIVTTTLDDPSYWTTDGDIIQSGSYNADKKVWIGHILEDSIIMFTICDAMDTTCCTTVTIEAPETCSDPCELQVAHEVYGCDDNGTPDDPTDDLYFVTLSILGTNGEAWEVVQKFSDGTQNILSTGVGNGSITYTLPTQEGDFTMQISLADYYDCLVDFYIDAPSGCGGCLDVMTSNIQCYDNGSSDPSDDYWTFDIFVTGPNDYWETDGDIEESGGYNQTKTIWVGKIEDHPFISFTVRDNEDRLCFVEIKLEAPESCSDDCKVDLKVKISDCKDTESGGIFYAEIYADESEKQCFTVIKVNLDGTKEEIGNFEGTSNIPLGPFDANEDFSLLVILCDSKDCVRDFYINAPDCGKGDDKVKGRSVGSFIDLSISPNPSVNTLNINTTLETGTYQLISFDGRELLKGDLTGTTSSIDVSNIRSGVYFLRVTNEANSVQIAKVSILK